MLPLRAVASTLIPACRTPRQDTQPCLALTTTSTPATANSAYVVAGFAGGAAASALAGLAFGHWGWGGVCAVAGLWLVLGWGTTAVRR